MAPAPLLCSGDGPRPRWPVCLPIVAYCFVALCLAGSSSARRFNRIVSDIEDNIETRCFFFHGRSPASAKAGDHFKPTRAIVRDQIPASGI